jgi:hypothetical protein
LPEQPYLFLSHSSHDRDFTNGLAAQLTDAGFHCWVDVEEIPDGSTWVREIESAVAGCGGLIVVMSKPGRDSQWVERETLMAMELRKPVFVVRIDDTPLPLHLINLQFSDFRLKPDAALRKLIAALKRASLGAPLPEPKPREQQKRSPNPNPLNYFEYLEQLPEGEINARIARALFDWAKDCTDSLTFSGRSEPAFHAHIWLGAGGVVVFSVRAFPKQPAVEVPLQYLMPFPPFDQPGRRLETLRGLEQFAPEPFDDSRADRRPNIPLIALATDDALAAFQTIMKRLIDDLRDAV